MPSPEKKYWRPIPIYNRKLYEKFIHYDQFQRICYYWNEINQHVYDEFKFIPKEQKLVIKFEDLLINKLAQEQIIEYIGIKKKKGMFKSFSKPVNVHKPINYKLNYKQTEAFYKICSPMMAKFNYVNTKEYDVEY